MFVEFYLKTKRYYYKELQKVLHEYYKSTFLIISSLIRTWDVHKPDFALYIDLCFVRAPTLIVFPFIFFSHCYNRD